MALTQVTSIGLKDGEIVNADLHSAASVALSKLADSGALGSAVTATTQSASDDSTKLATTAFVQAAVTSLIDGAPGSLNTLNELAAAINDDSSYATTLTTALATKLPLVGGILTGDTTLANTKKVIFNHSSGAGAFIKHQSGHFEIISSVGNTYFAAAGTLYLRTNGNTNALTLDTSQNATFAGTATFAGGTCNGSFTVSSTEPRIYLTDTNNNSDFEIRNVDGIFRIFDSTNTRNCLAIDSSGDTTFAGNLAIGGNLYFDSDTDTTISNANTANWLRFITGGQTVMDITDTHHVQIHDDHRLRFGASNDIQIWHHSGNGRNYFFSPSNDVYHEFAVSNSWTLQTTAGDKRIECPANGTDTGVRLYHNGSEKFRTTSGGCHSYGVLSTSNAINIGNSANLTFEDNGKATFGNSADLEIYHSGSNSIINDAGTGSLRIAHNGNNHWEFGDAILKGNDGRKIVLGDSSDLTIIHESNINKIQGANSKNIYIQGDDVAILNQAGNQTAIWCNSGAAVQLYYANSERLSTTSTGVNLEGTTDGVLNINTSHSNGSFIRFKYQTNTQAWVGCADGLVAGGARADLGLRAVSDIRFAPNDGTLRCTIDTSGNFYPAATTTQNLGAASLQWASIYGQNLISASGYPLQFYANNSYAGRITTYGEWRFQVGTNSDNNVSTDYVHAMGGSSLDSVTSNLARFVLQERVGVWMSFKNGSGTHYGSIYLSNSNVVYGGTSDYRYKENVAPLTGAITTLKLLKPITYTWNELSKFDNTDTHRGFLAHEVQEVEPDAVSGTKDGMTISGNCVDASGETTQINVPETHKKEGETWTKTTEVIDIQQLDERKLVPILTAALQEAVTKIETLETKVAALEAG